ncbi:unnamed protein product [Mytilus coruscus]|uniref:Peptidase A2 domain-containing protein n=1 Tax=Mytilus coruscus TaxID=42192 RepID=A0A6J8CVL3_MYTCO|nr:unnamed protein product [Mytilus coruscus]
MPEEAKNCDDVTTAKILEHPNPHGALVRVYGVANMMVKGHIESVPINWKIDTGAKRTFITEHIFNSIIEKPQLSPVDANYIAADGHSLKCKEAVMLVIFNDHVFEHKIIVGGVKYNLLGEDFIPKNRCTWDPDESSFIIKGSRFTLGNDGKGGSGTVVALQTILVPAGHEAIVKSSVVNKLDSPCKQSFLGILTPEKLFMEKFGLAIARALVDTNQSVIFTRVFNPGSSDVIIYQNTHMALLTPIDKVGPVLNLNVDVPICRVSEISEDNCLLPEYLTDVYERGCVGLTEEQRQKFKVFLCKMQECLAKPGEEGNRVKLMDKILEGQSVDGVTNKSHESPTMSSNNSGDMDGQQDCSIPGEIPIVRRGRRPNRPPPARRKPPPKIGLDITSMRQQQEEDDIMGEILKLKIDGNK